MAPPLLLASLGFLVLGSSAQIQVTQFPGFQIVAPGVTVTLRCQASSNVFSWINWYLQKPGQAPRLLVAKALRRHTGVPERLRGDGEGTDFTLTISDAQPEDSGVYYCQQTHSDWFTRRDEAGQKPSAAARPQGQTSGLVDTWTPGPYRPTNTVMTTTNNQ